MRAVWLLGATLLWCGVASAAPTPREVVGDMIKCSQIASAADRLKCFDAVTADAQTAWAQTSAEPGAQRADDEGGGGVLNWFGLEKPVTKPEDFGRPPAAPAGPKEVTSVAANVVEFARTPRGRAIFILDNAQVWRQIDGDSAEIEDPDGESSMKIVIEKAIFGSYNLYIDGRRGFVKVRRIK